tara:strand:- start:2845 stop:4341 length:1497 start_codon:yes stop_codon:yes gene_type:complete
MPISRPNPNIPLSATQPQFATMLTQLNNNMSADRTNASNLQTAALQRTATQQNIDINAGVLQKATELDQAKEVILLTNSLPDILRRGDKTSIGQTLQGIRDLSEQLGAEDFELIDNVSMMAMMNPDMAADYLEQDLLPALRPLHEAFAPSTEVDAARGQTITTDPLNPRNPTATPIVGAVQPAAASQSSRWSNQETLGDGTVIGTNNQTGRREIVPQTDAVTELLAGQENDSGRASGVRADQIRDLMEQFGMSEREAVESVDREHRIDPSSGNLIAISPDPDITPRIIRLANQDKDADIQNPRNSTQEDFGFDVGAGTGFWTSVKNLYNQSLANVIPVLPEFEGIEASALRLGFLQEGIIDSFASSDRPPVVQQNRLTALVPTPLSYGTNPESAREQTREVVDLMLEQYVDDLVYSTNESNPRTVRTSSANRMRGIEQTVRQLLTQEAGDELFGFVNNQVETQMVIPRMTLEEMQSLNIGELTDEQLETLKIQLQGKE